MLSRRPLGKNIKQNKQKTKVPGKFFRCKLFSTVQKYEKIYNFERFQVSVTCWVGSASFGLAASSAPVGSSLQSFAVLS